MRHAEAGWGRVHPNPLVGALVVVAVATTVLGPMAELTAAIESIRSFAQQFHNITVQLRTMDDQIASSSSAG